jgi:hypothetical protein
LKLWTIQTIEAWNELQTTGTLRCKEELIDLEDFNPAYKWMISLWAWYQWKDDKHKRPDLRSNGFAPKGEKSVFIELNAPDETVLLSDFNTWHHTLGYWYIPLNELDDEKFTKELEEVSLDYHKINPLPEPYHSKILKSWEIVFDLDYYNEYINYPK